MSKEKSSKTLMVFGILLLITIVSTLVFLCLTKYNPHYWDDVLISFGAISMLGIVFLLYIKEVRIKENWSKIPLVGRTIWWMMFIAHSYNFIEQFMVAFIFR